MSHSDDNGVSWSVRTILLILSSMKIGRPSVISKTLKIFKKRVNCFLKYGQKWSLMVIKSVPNNCIDQVTVRRIGLFFYGISIILSISLYIHCFIDSKIDVDWLEGHAFISKYCLQIAKCDGLECCQAKRTNLQKVLGKFLPTFLALSLSLWRSISYQPKKEM